MDSNMHLGFAKLLGALKTYGFVQSKADYSLFTKLRGNQFVAVLIYVDDLLMAGNNQAFIDEVKRNWHNSLIWKTWEA